MASPLFQPLVPVLGGVLILALNFWALTPLTARVFSESTSNVIYLVIRLATFAWVGGWLRFKTDRRVIQILSLVTICAFFDQVIFKLGLLRDPSRTGGMQAAEIWVSLMMSYLLFLPLVIVLAYLGVEIGSWLKKK